MRLKESHQYPDDKFDEAFRRAMIELVKDPSINSSEGKLHSNDPYISSMACAMSLFLAQYLPHITALTAGFVSVIVARIWIWKWAQQRQQVRTLLSKTIMELQNRKSKWPDNAAVVVDHLRDTLLDSTSQTAAAAAGDSLPPSLSQKTKSTLWLQVQSLIQADSRVLESVCWRHGVQVTTWEWEPTVTEGGSQ